MIDEFELVLYVISGGYIYGMIYFQTKHNVLTFLDEAIIILLHVLLDQPCSTFSLWKSNFQISWNPWIIIITSIMFPIMISLGTPSYLLVLRNPGWETLVLDSTGHWRYNSGTCYSLLLMLLIPVEWGLQSTTYMHCWSLYL